MSAKKKRAHRETVGENNVRLRARLGELLSDHFKDVDRIAALEKKLARTQQISVDQSDKLADRAKEITELAEQLGRTERAYDAEVAFWRKEVEHLQQRAVDAVISAVKK